MDFVAMRSSRGQEQICEAGAAGCNVDRLKQVQQCLIIVCSPGHGQIEVKGQPRQTVSEHRLRPKHVPADPVLFQGHGDCPEDITYAD